MSCNENQITIIVHDGNYVECRDPESIWQGYHFGSMSSCVNANEWSTDILNGCPDTGWNYLCGSEQGEHWDCLRCGDPMGTMEYSGEGPWPSSPYYDFYCEDIVEPPVPPKGPFGKLPKDSFLNPGDNQIRSKDHLLKPGAQSRNNPINIFRRDIRDNRDKSRDCPTGYSMNPIKGICQESISIYQSQNNNNFPQQRNVPACCTQPNSSGKCYFGCVPCIMGDGQAAPGPPQCFQITDAHTHPFSDGCSGYMGTEQVMVDVEVNVIDPETGFPQINPITGEIVTEITQEVDVVPRYGTLSMACMFKLEQIKHLQTTGCSHMYGQLNGSVSVSCHCWAFENQECPGQGGTTDTTGNTGPKSEFRRGGRIRRRGGRIRRRRRR
tara:strand:+ start:4956 stop:6098 length:1143 start_codon:yes stop_codon:yes gene_type:complete